MVHGTNLLDAGDWRSAFRGPDASNPRALHGLLHGGLPGVLWVLVVVPLHAGRPGRRSTLASLRGRMPPFVLGWSCQCGLAVNGRTREGTA